MFAAVKNFLKSDLVYEARPFICLFAALVSFKKVQYPIPGAMFGGILLFCALSIFYFRGNARGFFKALK